VYYNLLMSISRGFIAVMLALALTPASAQTALAAPSATISISVFDPTVAPLVLVPVFSWRADGKPLEFSASVSRADSRPVDAYFGAIAPGGRVFSWTSGLTTVPVLLEGLFAAARGVTSTQFTTAALLGANPQRAFSNEALSGLYAVFMLLVPHGGDPFAPSQWLAATMSPLVVSP
jgi:hypothetical protein